MDYLKFIHIVVFFYLLVLILRSYLLNMDQLKIDRYSFNYFACIIQYFPFFIKNRNISINAIFIAFFWCPNSSFSSFTIYYSINYLTIDINDIWYNDF